MLHSKTTPVPNVLFDAYLKRLSSAELKVLLVIVRKTLGWSDKQASNGRKEVDWISNSQLQAFTGCSRRAISTATESLVNKRLIEVLHENGSLLDDPQKRKGKQRLYYRISYEFYSPVENSGKESSLLSFSELPCAIIAQDLSKKVTALAQKMRITKETLQN
ncbi:MAG TPA: replication protein [Bacteroidia bacterium]|nr:replication protein [Bacteroidia bacterium]